VNPPSPEIPDEDYARLSAEKQVFEKSKNRGKTPQSSLEEKEKNGSEAGSSVDLGVVAGEVSPPVYRLVSPFVITSPFQYRILSPLNSLLCFLFESTEISKSRFQRSLRLRHRQPQVTPPFLLTTLPPLPPSSPLFPRKYLGFLRTRQISEV
jgi:hypothetical protein